MSSQSSSSSFEFDFVLSTILLHLHTQLNNSGNFVKINKNNLGKLETRMITRLTYAICGRHDSFESFVFQLGYKIY
jgi:hypothetical protein